MLPTDDGCWVLVGDVAGKGSAAAGVSVAVRHAVRGLTREVDEPEEVLGRVNELLLEGTGLNDFATAVLVRLRADEGGEWTLAAASAGHPPPVHVRRGGARLLGGGTVLGALHDAKVQRHDANFAEGDTLALLHRRLARGGAARRSTATRSSWRGWPNTWRRWRSRR